MKKIILFISVIMILAMNVIAFASGEKDSGFDGQYVEAMGFVPLDQHMGSKGANRAMARQGAIMDAQRNLIANIKGTNIDAETTMENKIVTSDIVKAKVNGLIQGADIVKEDIKDDMYIVTMRVPAFGSVSSLASVAMDPWKKEDFPAPTTQTYDNYVKDNSNNNTVITTTTSNGNATTTTTTTTTTSSPAPAVNTSTANNNAGGYTGVIIDCRGMNISTAMSPVIHNEEHKAIYGAKNLDYKYVIANGMAGYSHGDSNLSRAGSNPIVIKAISVYGYFTPVISNKDADMILILNKTSHFLDKAAVVIERD